MAVYVTSRCPHCGKVYRYRESNPCHYVESPFVSCSGCGNFFKDSYREEWITKSPLKRHWFFLQDGTWARAMILPLIIIGPLFGAAFDLPELVFPLWIFSCITWLVCGYLFHKKRTAADIEESLKRTEDPQYVDLLKKAGYKIYPLNRDK